MLTESQTIIQHFSHNHPLTEANVVGTYTCDGCKLCGTGKTYRCNDCDYDLHEYCATCPQTLGNSWHAPDHELSMINGPTQMNERGCYVCRAYIQGMFYKCKQCSFESHPSCTHGPTPTHMSPSSLKADPEADSSKENKSRRERWATYGAIAVGTVLVTAKVAGKVALTVVTGGEYSG